MLILATGALWAPAAARVLDTSLRYTIDKTTREVLFLPLPANVKYRAKPFVDVTMDRLAKAGGALLILVLIKPWGLNLSWRSLSYASLVVSAGARGCDEGCDARRPPFLAIVAEDPGEVGFVVFCNDLCCG